MFVVLVALLLTVVAAMTLWWMLHAWRSPATFESIRQGVRGEPQLSFSLIVPCRDETQEVMDETVRRLLAQDHPDFEVIISLGHDDLTTIAAAQNIVDRYPDRVRLSINHEHKKSKPVQLNSSLLECTKDVVGIIDAESLTAPGLLRRIDSTFRAEGADIVTQEETPDSVGQFIKQRTRWSLGFMQVMAKGEWKKLPTFWERGRAVLLLGQQYTVAFSGLVLPLAVLSALLGNLPVLVVILAFLPLIPSILTLCFEILILLEFGQDIGVKIRLTDCVWLVVCTPLYQLMLAYSSLRAVVKYYQGNFAWEKTSHAGAHLDLPLLQPEVERAA